MELDLALGAGKGRRGGKKRKEGEVKREIDRICKKREEREKGRIKRAAQPPPRSLLTFVIRQTDKREKSPNLPRISSTHTWKNMPDKSLVILSLRHLEIVNSLGEELSKKPASCLLIPAGCREMDRLPFLHLSLMPHHHFFSRFQPGAMWQIRILWLERCPTKWLTWIFKMLEIAASA